MAALIKSIVEKWVALYVRLSRDDENEGDSNSIAHHDVMYRGWITPKKHYIMTGGSFVANEKTVMIKPANKKSSPQEDLTEENLQGEGE